MLSYRHDGEKERYAMRTIVETTLNLENRYEKLKAERMNLTSITDKAMTALAVEEIKPGAVKALTIFSGVDDETGEKFETAVISTDDANYSGGAIGLIELVSSLISDIDDEMPIEIVGFSFGYGNTRNGNKYLKVDLI